MEKALVIGAAGFVGRHLIPKLVDAGFAVTAIDPKLDPKAIHNSIKFYQMPFETWYDNTENWLDVRFDVVVHLGANIINVNDRMNLGITAFEDITLDYAVCRYVEQIRPKRFIAMSSCAVDFPADPYCIIKRNLEAMASTLVKGGLEVQILRPFSGYGGDQTEEYPFPAILHRAIRKENPLVVWGGQQIRDWLHINDLIAAIMYGIDGKFPDGIPIEIGTGKGINFIKLAEMMARAVGYEPVVIGDITKESSSLKRISELRNTDEKTFGQQYGWHPTITIAQGIKKELDKTLGI